MRFHFLMLLIVILVSLGMHGMASARVSSSSAVAPFPPGSVGEMGSDPDGASRK